MLRKKQGSIVKKMLMLNKEDDSASKKAEWKVLIYDERGQSLLSTLLSENALVDLGVTFRSLITQKRDPIPNVAAIYFVEPSDENIDLIVDDCRAGLYDTIYINFISAVSSQGMTRLAKGIGENGDPKTVAGVFDQYIDFNSLHAHLFTLGERDNHIIDIYGYKTPEDVAVAQLKAVGGELANVFLTLGEIPNVVMKEGSEVAKHVAGAMMEKLRSANPDFMLSRKTEAGGEPLLILFERTFDVSAPLHHPSRYQALIHDLYGIARNRCTVDGKEHVLDPETDKFWEENAMKGFDEVITRNTAEMKEFQKEYAGLDKDLSTAISALPELQERRQYLTTHTHIASDITSAVRARKADELFKIESDFFVGRKVSKETILSMLQNTPDENDRLRFITIAYLCDYLSNEDLQDLSKFAPSGLAFLDSYLGGFKIRNRKKQSYFAQLISDVSDQDSITAFPIAAVTREILKGHLDGFCDESGHQIRQLKNFSSVFVFVIGPGSYIEYNGAVSISNELPTLNITYGCTSIPRPSDFMSQLMRIGGDAQL